MIDLHCHSNFSDGEFAPNTLLKKAENLKLTYFSITDHNNCFAYENLDTSNFSGILIPGVEIATSFEKHIIEVLGYGVNSSEINKWNRAEKEKEPQYAKIVYDKFVNILEKQGISYTTNDSIVNENCTTGKVKQYFYQELLKEEKNRRMMGEETLSSYSNFNKKGLNNPNSILFMNEWTRFLSLEKAVELIHNSGGLCFLAHVYQYNVANHIQFIDRILKTVKLDGLEIYHSSFSKEQIAQISTYAEKNNLYKSGGSDYHGKLKPGIKLGMDLQISEEIIRPWVSKIAKCDFKKGLRKK